LLPKAKQAQAQQELEVATAKSASLQQQLQAAEQVCSTPFKVNGQLTFNFYSVRQQVQSKSSY
jgi:hypothetical protein